MRSLYISSPENPPVELPLERIAERRAFPDSLLWLDFDAEPNAEEIAALSQEFDLQQLVLENALSRQHSPRLDDWGAYLYLVVHDVKPQDKNGRFSTPQLVIFLGPQFLITLHKGPAPAIRQVWETVQRESRQPRRGADYLLYHLLDAIAENFMRVIGLFEEVVAGLEDDIFERLRPEVLERIFESKRNLLHLRRVLEPQREVLNKLVRENYSMIDKKDRILLRELRDHFGRMFELADSLRELTSGALDTYFLLVNNRTSEVVKALTTITTIFMPISFVAAFFGMNFFFPETPISGWLQEGVFRWVLVVIAIIPFLVFWWIRRWLDR
jgi:magnesium transporter